MEEEAKEQKQKMEDEEVEEEEVVGRRKRRRRVFREVAHSFELMAQKVIEGRKVGILVTPWR